MPTYQANTTVNANITINGKKYDIRAESFGAGHIPIIICGHAEIYARHLYKAFAANGLLKKYRFFVPLSYWCEDAPLASLPAQVLQQLTLAEMVKHIEEIRSSLVDQGLLQATAGKIGIYSHSFFSALAFHYAATYRHNILFIEAEGPPPYSTQEWSKEKALYFNANASDSRKKALKREEIDPGSSTVDEKSMESFATFRDAYHRMNSTVWYDYETDHRSELWGDKNLHMAMMKHYFNKLLDGYDSRKIISQIGCPVHLSLGILDTPVPPYLWLDPPKEGGVGFFNNKNKKRDYHIHPKSAHWSSIEQPDAYCRDFDKFVSDTVMPQLSASLRNVINSAEQTATAPQLRARL
jgi:pimeloyl-ACP methyl ester carboxylesterase